MDGSVYTLSLSPFYFLGLCLGRRAGPEGHTVLLAGYHKSCRMRRQLARNNALRVSSWPRRVQEPMVTAPFTSPVWTHNHRGGGYLFL